MTQVCSVRYVDHVGLAVADVEEALSFFQRVFGAPAAEVVTLEDQGVRACLVAVGQTRLELLQPLTAETAVGRFLERRGPGLHHLAFNVEDVSESLAAVKGLGLEVIDEEPREGLSGTIAFIHPRAVFGTLTELVQSAEPEG